MSLGNIFGFYKTRHILLSNGANHRATCRRFGTIPACDGLTDRQTDGIAVANTALAIHCARCKKEIPTQISNVTKSGLLIATAILSRQWLCR